MKLILYSLLIFQFPTCSSIGDWGMMRLASNDKSKEHFTSHFSSGDGPVNIRGVLKFSDAKAFITTLSSLILESERRNEAFVAGYLKACPNEMPVLDRSQMKDLLEISASSSKKSLFIEDAAFIEFEKKHHFISLRSKIENEMRSFLSRSKPCWRQSPDNHFILGDAERTLFNPDGVIMIGNSIFKVTADGWVLEIVDGNFQTLDKINLTDDVSVFTAPNVLIRCHGENRRSTSVVSISTCEASKSAGFLPILYNYGINQFTGSLSNRNYGFYAVVISCIQHYEWNGNTWSKANAYLQTQNWGETSDTISGNLCGPPKSHQSPLKIKFGSRLCSRHITHLGQPKTIRTQPWWLHSTHIANTSGHLFHLVW